MPHYHYYFGASKFAGKLKAAQNISVDKITGNACIENIADSLIKYDFSSGKSEIHPLREGCCGGEAIFVPRPDATVEDDGWLVTFVHDEREGTSELLVLNAQEITAEPVARVLIPQRVPYGFHGIWISEEQLAE